MKKSKYIPNDYYKNIHEINYERLKNKGIKLLIFDVDNTLGLVKEPVIPNKSRELIKKLLKDFIVVIASNSRKERVTKFVDNLCYFVHTSLKPTKRLSRVIKKKFNIDNNKCCIIGDQLVTDILLGNKVGYHTILVDPLGPYGKVSTINRFFERIVKKKLQFKDGEYFEKD